jgi:hypothetical protein
MNNTIIAPLLLALLGAASCFSVQPAPTLSLSTHPPGALVLINGEETGFATPCILAVEEELIRVEIVLEGYDPETRIVTRDPKLETRYWSEMNAGSRTWRFPLFLPIHDLFASPVREVMILAPGRIFIRMDRRIGEAR